MRVPHLKEGNYHMSNPTQTATLGDRVVKKVTQRIIPYLILLYILAYIGRSNLGYAALTMNVDLRITDAQFGFVAGIFFIGYFIFEVPSNILLDKFGARVWIARILLTWGLVIIATAFVQNVTQLYILRFLLGVAEAGFFPGVVLYLSRWFPDRHAAKSISLFMLAIPFSYMIGAPLFGYVVDHAHWLNLESWRWVFIVGGIPSVIFGILTFFILPNSFRDVKWLNLEEKKWLGDTLELEASTKLKAKGHFSKEVFFNKPLWVLILIYFACQMGEYALGFWTPQVIGRVSETLSASQVGWLTAATYVLGAFAMVWWGRHSDKTLERRWHNVLPLLLAAVGLVLMGYTVHSMWSVLVLALITAGVYAIFGPFWALPSQFLTGSTAVVGIAMINSFGNLAGFISPTMIGIVGNVTGNLVSGFYVIAGVMVVAIVFALFGIKNSRPSETVVRQNAPVRVSGKSASK